jgi:ribosomal protein S18 acetylase RimI-like enzyme
MSTTTIRLAETHDVAVIHELLGQLADDLGEQHAYRGDTDALHRCGFGPDRLFTTLLAERDGVAVGMCIYFPEFSTWRGQPGVYVQDLIVSGAVRGEGTGRELLAAAMAQAERSWGARYLRLAVGVDNNEAIGFYARIGMVADHDNQIMILATET